MGRPRKSIQLSKRLGTAESQRILNRTDVSPGPPPEAPLWLSTDAAKVWQDVVPSLIAANLVQLVDSHSIGQYCEAAASYLREKRRRKNRNESEIARWFGHMIRLARDLGMTPRSRTALTLPAAEKKSKLDEFRISPTAK